MRDRLELRANRIDQVLQPFFHYYDLRTAVIQDVVEVIGHESEVERHQDRTQQRRAEERFEDSVTVLREDCDAGALLDAERSHRVRPAVHPFAELAISQTQIATNNGFLV